MTSRAASVTFLWRHVEPTNVGFGLMAVATALRCGSPHHQLDLVTTLNLFFGGMILVLCGMFSSGAERPADRPGSAPRIVAWTALVLSVYSLAVSTSPAGRADPPHTVTVPLHGAYVSDPVMTAADGKKLDARVTALERWRAAQEGGPAKTAKAADALLPVAARYCARCHTPEAADSGGGFVLFATDDARGFAPGLTDYQQGKVRQLVADGRMPIGKPKPTPEEKALFTRFQLK